MSLVPNSFAWPARLPSSLLLRDTLDSDDAEAGVFIADFLLELALFDIVCLDRIHISEL
jgi:hypothetical protein